MLGVYSGSRGGSGDLHPTSSRSHYDTEWRLGRDPVNLFTLRPGESCPGHPAPSIIAAQHLDLEMSSGPEVMNMLKRGPRGFMSHQAGNVCMFMQRSLIRWLLGIHYQGRRGKNYQWWNVTKYI